MRFTVFSIALLVAFTTAAVGRAASAQVADAGNRHATREDIHGRVATRGDVGLLPRATIEASGTTDTAAHHRALTDSAGSFRIEGLAPGHYRVRIRALGFSPRTLTAVVSAEKPSVDLGTILLTSAPVTLERMVVSERQRQVELAPDRNTYYVHDMPSTSGGSALDVLRNVPSVDVDIDNVVSLRADAGVVVQINGRKSPMTPTQLGNFLAQLPANMVEKVEVITNPGANENPDGVAGIINIVLKKEPDATASAGLTVTGGTTGRVEIGGNGGYQSGPLTLFGSYGFMRDDRPRSESIFRENLYADPLTYLEEAGSRTELPLAHTLTGSAGYRLGMHDELSTDLLFSARTEHNNNSFLYRNLDASYALTGMTDRVRQEQHHEYNLQSTLAYKHGFATKGHTLTAEARIFRGREGGPNQYVTEALSPNGSPVGAFSLESATGWEHPSEGTMKFDYVQPLAAGWRFSSGYKGWLQQFHTTLDTRVFDSTQATYVLDPARSSDFNFDELVHAGYGMITGAVGAWEMEAGVRLERATTRFRLNRTAETYDNSYTSAFPSGLVAYNVNEADQIKLSYSTRIRRPDDSDLLDPTIHYQDPLNLSRGNPKLQPEYIRSFELGVQHSTDRLTFQVTPFYRHTLNAVRRIRSIDSAGVTTTTFANVATTDAYGTDGTLALHGGRVTGFLGASAFRQVSNAANIAPGLSARTFGWTARTNVTYHASSTFDVQALLFYRGPMTMEQGRMASQARINVAARKKLMGDRANITLRVVDPFRTEHWQFTTTDPQFQEVSDFTPHVRGVLLSLGWNFGKPLEDHGDQSEGTDSGAGSP